MHEMRDVGPVDPVVVVEGERRSRGFRADSSSQISPSSSAVTSPRAALVVHLALELVEGDLPDHGVQHVLDLLGQHDLAPGRVALAGQQRPEGQHLAEHAGGLGQGQRRVGHELALRAGQHLVHAVAELVGQGHDVRACGPDSSAAGRGETLGTVGCAKAPEALPGRTGASIQSALEEALADGGQVRREGAVGVQHRRLRLGPGDGPVVARPAAARCGPNRAASPDPIQRAFRA